MNKFKFILPKKKSEKKKFFVYLDIVKINPVFCNNKPRFIINIVKNFNNIETVIPANEKEIIFFLKNLKKNRLTEVFLQNAEDKIFFNFLQNINKVKTKIFLVGSIDKIFKFNLILSENDKQITINFKNLATLLPVNLKKISEWYKEEYPVIFNFSLFYSNGNRLFDYLHLNDLCSQKEFLKWIFFKKQYFYEKVFSKVKKTNILLLQLYFSKKYNLTVCSLLKKIGEKIFLFTQINFFENSSFSSFVFNVFQKNFLTVSIEKLNFFYEKFIRMSYYGGRSEFFKEREFSSYFYDINSAYGFIMRKSCFPINAIGFTTEVSFSNVENFFGFALVTVLYQKNIKYLPLLPYYKNNKLSFPIGSWKGVYFSEELKYAKKLGYVFIVNKFLLFEKKSKIFNVYMDFWFEKKNYLDNHIKFFSKLMLNTLYGRIGMLNCLTCYFVGTREEKNLVNKKFIKSTFLISDNKFFLKLKEHISLTKNEYKTKNLEKENYNFRQANTAISSSVTSYLRIFLYPVASYFFKKKNLIYIDTDCVIVKTSMPELLVGKKLGSWKLIHEISEILIVGVKAYYLKTIRDKTDEVLKMKGVKHVFLKKQIYDELLKNKTCWLLKKEEKHIYTKNSIEIFNTELKLEKPDNPVKLKLLNLKRLNLSLTYYHKFFTNEHFNT